MERKDLVDKGRRELVNIKQIEKMAGGGTPLRKLIKLSRQPPSPTRLTIGGAEWLSSLMVMSSSLMIEPVIT